mmetsp:Transcript_63506/g.182340  ORF Transcript_63506/g.182340 Transcript_63506/m.182340 type:complete len:227 (+) Transcript_63506:77-757(+)
MRRSHCAEEGRHSSRKSGRQTGITGAFPCPPLGRNRRCNSRRLCARRRREGAGGGCAGDRLYGACERALQRWPQAGGSGGQSASCCRHRTGASAEVGAETSHVSFVGWYQWHRRLKAGGNKWSVHNWRWGQKPWLAYSAHPPRILQERLLSARDRGGIRRLERMHRQFYSTQALRQFCHVGGHGRHSLGQELVGASKVYSTTPHGAFQVFHALLHSRKTAPGNAAR